MARASRSPPNCALKRRYNVRTINHRRRSHDVSVRGSVLDQLGVMLQHGLAGQRVFFVAFGQVGRQVVAGDLVDQLRHMVAPMAQQHIRPRVRVDQAIQKSLRYEGLPNVTNALGVVKIKIVAMIFRMVFSTRGRSSLPVE